MTRNERLSAFWRAVDGRPVTWGVDDCSAWSAAWVTSETGIPDILPPYGSEEEARAVIEAAGGIEALWDVHTAHFGLYETGAPDVGDVGLVRTSRFGTVGMIFAANGLAIWRSLLGVTFIQPRPATIVRAWRVPEKPE